MLYLTVGHIIDRIQGMIDDDSTETRTDILRHLNVAYQELAMEHVWSTFTKTMTGIPTSGILPGDFVRFIHVEDGENVAYFVSGRLVKYSDPRYYKYFKDVTTQNTPLESGSDGVIAANGTAFSSATAAFTSAMENEYIRIGENLGIYKISTVSSATAIVLDNGFRGAAETAAYYEVRPIGTPKCGFLDEDADALTSTTATIWYQTHPLPLYNDYDPILLPGTCEALRIRLCQLMDQTNKYDNDALKKQGEYDKALALMKDLDPIPERFIVPRDKNGNRLMFGRNRAITYSYVPDSGQL